MTKNIFIFSLLASFVLFSCSGDDDSGTQASIVGKWAYVDTVVNGVSYPYDDHEPCGKDYIEFKSDNTFISVDIWDCEVDIDDQGNYTFENNTLTINGEAVTVSELTQAKLSLTGTEDYDGDGSLDDIILNFERL